MVLQKKTIIIFILMLPVFMIIHCGDKSTDSPPVIVKSIDPFAKDTLAVRKILDTNGLTKTPAGSVITNIMVMAKDTTKRISELRLQGKNITVIPKEIGELTKLHILNLDNNAISSLPAEIGQCSTLTYLTLSHNNLTSIPPEIGAFDSLSVLMLTHNALSTLPEEIGNLSLLEIFYLDSNLLTTLPATLSSLDKMTRLALDDNRLTDLPSTMNKLPRMYVTINKNKLCAVPDTVKKWLDDNADEWKSTQDCP